MQTKKVRRLAMLFAVMLVISIIAGHSHSLKAASSLGKDTLTMITSPDYPPYEFYDTQGGERQIVGFDIDIAKNLAQKLGFKLQVMESDFNGLIPALQANRADFVMAGMTPTPERQKNVDFSNNPSCGLSNDVCLSPLNNLCDACGGLRLRVQQSGAGA